MLTKERLAELHKRFDGDTDDDLSDVLGELDRPYRWQVRELMQDCQTLSRDKSDMENNYNAISEEYGQSVKRENVWQAAAALLYDIADCSKSIDFYYEQAKQRSEHRDTCD